MLKLSQLNLDKTRTITHKSKVKVFREEIQEGQRQESSEKLGNLVRRNISVSSTQEPVRAP
jgi:Tetratricopeptide repeat